MEEIKIEYYADIKNYFEAAKYFTNAVPPLTFRLTLLDVV